MLDPDSIQFPGPLYGTNSMWRGVKVQVHLGLPRYVMPEWLIPGVLKWPENFRRETNMWAEHVCGRTELVEDNQILIVNDGQRVIMNQATFQRLRAAGEVTSQSFVGLNMFYEEYTRQGTEKGLWK